MLVDHWTLSVGQSQLVTVNWSARHLVCLSIGHFTNLSFGQWAIDLSVSWPFEQYDDWSFDKPFSRALDQFVSLLACLSVCWSVCQLGTVSVSW